MMEYLYFFCGMICFILAVQLGRINNTLYSIEKKLENIEIHTSKEYLVGWREIRHENQTESPGGLQVP